MSEHIDDIETALRTPEPALADDDFSASVLARLPSRRRRSPARRWTLAGAAVAVVLIPALIVLYAERADR